MRDVRRKHLHSRNLMDKSEKKRLLKEWQKYERGSARGSLPLEPGEMKKLFDMLDDQLPLQGCDHTRRLTLLWLAQNNHDRNTVCSWLEENGGYCDCEVLANSEEAFIEAMR